MEEEGLESRLEPPREISQCCDDGGLHYGISQYFGEPGETSV